MINEQASAEPRDTECLFDPPSLGKQDETLGELRVAHDLDCDVQARHHGFEPPSIGAIGDDEDNPREECLDLAHQIDAASRSWTAPSVTSPARRWPRLSAR